jgi:ADP-dependent phosphofructokinase/glucokinase
MKTKEQLQESLRETMAEYEDAVQNITKEMQEDGSTYKSYLLDLEEDIRFLREQLKQHES